MTMQVRPHHPSKGSQGDFPYTNSTSGEKNQTYLFKIATEMKMAGISEIFIVRTVRTALDFEGVADLMKLWEKEEIIADIQDMIEACSQKERTEDIYVKFNDLDTIANNIRAFKDSLLQVVNERGGISHLAELTDIPQPSLSRFFNSNGMPHRSTLLKITKALKLDEIKIELLWTK